MRSIDLTLAFAIGLAWGLAGAGCGATGPNDAMPAGAAGEGEGEGEAASAADEGDCASLAEAACEARYDCAWDNGCAARSAGCEDYGDSESCLLAACAWKGRCVETCAFDEAVGCIESCEGRDPATCTEGGDVGICRQCCGACRNNADCEAGYECTAADEDLAACDGSAEAGTGHCVKVGTDPDNQFDAGTEDDCGGCLYDGDCGTDEICAFADGYCDCLPGDSTVACAGTCVTNPKGGGGPDPDTCCFDTASSTCVESCDDYADTSSCVCDPTLCDTICGA